MLRATLFLALVAAVGATELTADNFDAETSGKSVFIKFLAPWRGHCKSMKPAWDKLMGEFSGNPGVLIADVDCTEAGKDLCEKHEVQGFPTIKYGDPDELKSYEGGRSYEDLKKFASESLGPQCGPGENIGLCSEKVKQKIEKYLKMPVGELEEKNQQGDGQSEGGCPTDEQ